MLRDAGDRLLLGAVLRRAPASSVSVALVTDVCTNVRTGMNNTAIDTSAIVPVTSVVNMCCVNVIRTKCNTEITTDEGMNDCMAAVSNRATRRTAARHGPARVLLDHVGLVRAEARRRRDEVHHALGNHAVGCTMGSDGIGGAAT